MHKPPAALTYARLTARLQAAPADSRYAIRTVILFMICMMPLGLISILAAALLLTSQ